MAAVAVARMRKKPIDREDVDIEPHGELVKIYVAKSYRGVPVNDSHFKFWINGRLYKVVAGGQCIVPKEIYTQIKNCQSRRTVIDPQQAERLADLGLRTDKNAGVNPPTREDAMCDYEVVLLGSAGKQEV